MDVWHSSHTVKDYIQTCCSAQFSCENWLCWKGITQGCISSNTEELPRFCWMLVTLLQRTMIAFHSVEEIILKRSRTYRVFFSFCFLTWQMLLYLFRCICILDHTSFLGTVLFFQWWRGASGPLTQFLSTVRNNETSVQIPCDINFSNNVLDDEQQWCRIVSLLWIAPSARYETFKWETAPSR